MTLGIVLKNSSQDTSPYRLITVPAFLVKNKMLRKFIQKIPQHFPQWEHKVGRMSRQLMYNKYIIRVLFTIPTALLGLTMLASIERAPLTGR